MRSILWSGGGGKAKEQGELLLDAGDGLSTLEQEYNPTPIINEIRKAVEDWRNLPSPNQWQVSPETARLLQHWRHHEFQGLRPFFCQVEAVETVIWLTEVAPKLGARTARFWTHIKGANKQANPEKPEGQASNTSGSWMIFLLILFPTSGAMWQGLRGRFTSYKRVQQSSSAAS